MRRKYYVELAEAGLGFPIGADLVLKEYPDHEKILRDGVRLGRVVAEAAWRFNTPLAMPVMDLMLEKALILRALGGVAESEIPTWHFSGCPTEGEVAGIRRSIAGPLSERLQANVDAVRYIAEHTDLLPVGMSIGPFSLMTRLMADPITPVYLAGAGANDEPEVKTVETILEIAVETILRSLDAQARAGAQAFFIAEPAANRAYVSPRQMAEGSDVFERMVLKNLRRIKDAASRAGADLMLHCCGEMTPEMLKELAGLRPSVLSLGSSRKLWEDAHLIPKDVVIYGNLPSKKFFSDELISLDEVRRMARESITLMRETGHPYILGTECDVLSVPGCERTLMAKAMAIVHSAGKRRTARTVTVTPTRELAEAVA